MSYSVNDFLRPVNLWAVWVVTYKSHKLKPYCESFLTIIKFQSFILYTTQTAHKAKIH